MEAELQAVVGRNLRRIRKASGRSQETFGQDIQWHRTFVGAVERGERNLTLRTIEFLSDQLGVHPLDLLWEEGLGVRLDDDNRPHFIRPGDRAQRRAEPPPLAQAADDPKRRPGKRPDAAPPTKRTRPRSP